MRAGLLCRRHQRNSWTFNVHRCLLVVVALIRVPKWWPAALLSVDRGDGAGCCGRWRLVAQAALADSFLDDLDELDALSEDEEAGVAGAGSGLHDHGSSDDDAGGDDDGDDDDDGDGNLDDVLGILKDATGVRSVAKLRVLPRFIEHMRQVEASLATKRTGAASWG